MTEAKKVALQLKPCDLSIVFEGYILLRTQSPAYRILIMRVMIQNFFSALKHSPQSHSLILVDLKELPSEKDITRKRKLKINISYEYINPQKQYQQTESSNI